MSMSEAEILAGLFPSASSPAVQAVMEAEKVLIADLRNTDNRTLSEIREGTRAWEQHLRRASEETGSMQFAEMDYRDLSTVDKDSPDMNNPAIIRSGFVRATVGLFGAYRAKLKVYNHQDNPLRLNAELVYTGNQFEHLGIEASCIVCDPSVYPTRPLLAHFGMEMPVLTAQHAILPLFAKLLYSHLRLVGLGSHIALEQAYLIARDMLRCPENG